MAQDSAHQVNQSTATDVNTQYTMLKGKYIKYENILILNHKIRKAGLTIVVFLLSAS